MREREEEKWKVEDEGKEGKGLKRRGKGGEGLRLGYMG